MTDKKTKKNQVIFDRQKEKNKVKRGSKIQRFKGSKRIRPWVENKIKAARKLSKHRAARAVARFGAPAGVALITIFTLIPLLSPKTDFQKAKERLVKNPQDFEAHLILAEEFLKNNQFEEAERILLLAQRIKLSSYQAIRLSGEQVLGEEADVKLEELWERKRYSDPKDIRRLITVWGEILKEKPGYRDGHLQLALLYYKIYENEKAKEYLDKTIELDPNYEPTRKLEKVIK